MPNDLITAENLNALPYLRHAFFSRSYGVNVITNPWSPEDIHNRDRIAKHLGARSGHLALCRQVHATKVVRVDKDWDYSNPPEADALVTAEPHIAIGIQTADCVPILFVSPDARVVGAAHAGWRGALAGIIENTVAAMESLGAKRDTLCAAVGPCLWQNSYEVGPEFPEPFLVQDPKNIAFFKRGLKEGHWQFNLKGYVEAALSISGVRSVAPSFADTYADPTRFFSYRRDYIRGEICDKRLISAIALNNE